MLMPLRDLVDHVLRLFDPGEDALAFRLRPPFFEGAPEEQVPGFTSLEFDAVVEFVRTFRPERQELINRMQHAFPGIDEEFTERDVIMEIEDLARECLEGEMVRMGLDQEGARTVARFISLSRI
jgi:hypothetical protein